MPTSVPRGAAPAVTKRLLHTDPATGTLCVTIPAAEARYEGESEPDFLARIAAKDVPAGRPVRVVDVAALPPDRVFRDAWIDTGAAVAVDMVRARKIHEGRLKAKRDALLDALRKEAEKADDDGDSAKLKALKDRRKALRALDATLPAMLATLTTPEALAAYVPPELV